MTEWRFFCWDIILQKVFFNTNNCWKFSRAFGTHPDSFIYGKNLQLHQNEAANNSKLHHWWRDPDGLWKLCKTFIKLLVLKIVFCNINIFCFFFKIINEFLNQDILLNIFTRLEIRGLGNQLPFYWSIPGPN